MLRQTGTLLTGGKTPATASGTSPPRAPATRAPASRAAATRAAATRAAATRWLVGAALLSLLPAAALSLDRVAGHSASHSVPPAAQAGAGALSTSPTAARASISSALGDTQRAYRVEGSRGGFRASSPAQRLHAAFERTGLQLRSGTLALGLRLGAVGYGDGLRALVPVAPRAVGNRVLYRYRGLSEWYANGPLGLEQGFSVQRAPAGEGAGPLTLSMALSGNARASLARGGSSLLLSRAGGPSLRYGELVASDSRGRTLPSWLGLSGGRVLLRVDARGARYPLRIDPLFEQSKLTGSEESGGAQLGFSVALSADGNTAVLGGPEDNGGGGAAWVFTRTGSTWTQQGGKLTGGEESGNGHFGGAVRLSSDGNTLLLGGATDNGGVGAAWVFTRTGSSWSQQGPKLTGAEEIGKGQFGESVALSGDGNTALIGGPEDSGFAGAAWLFTRTGSSWSQPGSKLTGGAEEMGLGDFGYSVALSAHGSTALIGAATDGGTAPNGFVGAAWVYTRTGSTWTRQGPKLTSGANGEAGEALGAFGSSVALSADGNTALIGAFGEGRFSGAAWVFSRSGQTWGRPGTKLSGVAENGGAYFGYSVALSADGDHALVGGPEDAGKAGAAWAFTRAGAGWTQEKITATPPSPAAGFGFSVALSSSGATALVGGPEDSAKLGAAWAFLNPTIASKEELTGSSQNRGSGSATEKPVITHASQSRRRWREVERVAHISRAQAQVFMAAARANSGPFTHTSRRGKYRIFYYHGLTGHEYSKATRGGVGPKHNMIMVIPAGTTFSFTLNVQAAVSFSFSENVSGRRLKGKCVAARRAARSQPACTRSVNRGTLFIAGKAGRNVVPFEGLVSGSHKLAPGSYTLVITASNAAGRSSPKRLRFAILG